MLRKLCLIASLAPATAAFLREQDDRQLANIEGVINGAESSATGGRIFSMTKVRDYEGPRLGAKSIPADFERVAETCEKWAVLTSIFEPTETVKQLGAMADWCVVVVGDKKGPALYEVDGVVYLTPEDQEALPYKIVSLLPWNHFGRKNIGYLYAIHHGAKVIYDVDDDNALIDSAPGVPHTALESQLVRFSGSSKANVHNPYGCFGGPGNVWPRGYPLDAIHDTEASSCSVDEIGETPRVGVLQALANHDPDVDAIYRLTYPPGGLPFDFRDPPSSSSTLRVVPDTAFTPYNAQATLHFESAFWGMLLPVTVHGRVSDIWRSYFTQALLPAVHAVVGFSPPSVSQVRNVHSYLADFEAELPLYQRSGALVDFLLRVRHQVSEEMKSGAETATLPERIEALAVTMYEHDIIDYADVGLTQAWLEDLHAVRYCQSGTC